MKRLALGIGLAVLLVAGFAPAAVAAQWTLQSTPTLPGPPPPYPGAPPPSHQRRNLSAVSCTSGTACVAVGSDFATFTFTNVRGVSRPLTVQYTLAEMWNGQTWTIQSTPTPHDGGGLSGVSCTSTNACIAVGESNSLASGRTLAERWDGQTWTIQSNPTPAFDRGFNVFTHSAAFTGVSCVAGNACIAVGYVKPSHGVNPGAFFYPVAERWDGHTWKSLSLPSSKSVLTGVSCTSANACVAVGAHVTNNLGYPLRTLAEHWDGQTWTIQSTPTPASADGLSGVSCTSPTACVAVGSHGFAELWNGLKWTIQSTPTPARGLLEDVSCTSANACTGVGTVSGGTFVPRIGVDARTLAERYSGGGGGVVLDAVGNGTVTASWSPPSDLTAPAITGYTVTPTLAGNDSIPPPAVAPVRVQQLPASATSVTISGLAMDCHQLYKVTVTPQTSAGPGTPAVSSVFRPSGIVIPHKKPPYVVVLLDGIGSQAAGFRMDPYHPTAVGPDSYCPQNINNGIPVPITVGTGANKRPNNAFLAAPQGPGESFLKWNAWDPADNHGGNVPETDSNSTPRDLHTGKPTFQWMLDGIAATGAMILPYSYWGATLQGHGRADPTFVFNAYTDCNSTPAPSCTQDNHLDPGGRPDPSHQDYDNAVHSFSLSEDEDRLKTEIDSIEKVWRNEPIIIIGHSQGGLIAFETWRQHMLPGTVHHLFSLDSPINGVCAGQNIGAPQCVGPPGYPAYATRFDRDTDPSYLRQDGGSNPAFRFIGTLGDEVRVSNLLGTPVSTPSYGTGTDTLQVQLLVTGPNCTGTDHADCPTRVDHVSQCALPEQRWVLNRVTPVVTDQNRWIYDTGHFVVKFCPGNVAYFNASLGLSIFGPARDGTGAPNASAPSRVLAGVAGGSNADALTANRMW